jgi:hypothetical protein
MDVGSTVKISEIQAASIFRIEVVRLCEFSCTYISRRTIERKMDPGTPSGPIGTVDRDISERKEMALVGATDSTKNHEHVVFPRRCPSDITLLNQLLLCCAVSSPYKGRFFLTIFPYWLLVLSCLVFRNINMHTQKLTLPACFDAKYGGCRYLRNVGKSPLLTAVIA